MEGVEDERRADPQGPEPGRALGAGDLLAREPAPLATLAEEIYTEQTQPPPPVVTVSGIPVQGIREQENALLRGAVLHCEKPDRQRARMFVNHQCRWLEDATYRITASGMGKTFHCDLSWCVDPWNHWIETYPDPRRGGGPGPADGVR